MYTSRSEPVLIELQTNRLAVKQLEVGIVCIYTDRVTYKTSAEKQLLLEICNVFMSVQNLSLHMPII
jgi:hypothetical protein